MLQVAEYWNIILPRPLTTIGGGQCDQIWRNFATWQKNKMIRNFSRAYVEFTHIWTYYGQKIMQKDKIGMS